MDKTITPTKEQVINLLDAWIRQRPGLEYANYGDLSSYRAELRSITKDLHDARELLRAVELSNGLTTDELVEAFHAFAGRLQIEARPGHPNEYRLSYCTGQYWPTEYRKAACAVLASALWEYHLPDCMHYDHPGDVLRAKFRRMFGKGIQSRWLD